MENKWGENSPTQSLMPWASPSALLRLVSQGSQGLLWVLCTGAVVSRVPSHNSCHFHLLAAFFLPLAPHLGLVGVEHLIRTAKSSLPAGYPIIKQLTWSLEGPPLSHSLFQKPFMDPPTWKSATSD